ncbi:CD109 antigen [Anguilla rostrata]|uniref:CD109 antigen n=1 Tax=Anguilla rostrata TaxID=7938 RepID=UPI0030D0913A
MEWLQVIAICGILFVYCGAQTSSPKQNPSYLISAPRVLRPRIPTSLSVTVLTKSPVRVTSEIVNGNTSVVSAESLFQGGSTGRQVLPPIPDSAIHYSSPYQLVVKGYVGDSLVFTNTSFLLFNPKSTSTFIQTDKSIYSPGQAVKIRTVSILPDGKPCKSPVDIVIKDPKRNMILQWRALDGFLGVVSREFQLSENPPLGVWTIVASVDEVVSEKTFTVDYYVLPRFEVQIKAPKTIYYKDDLTGTVLTHYTYGKPVKGLLTVIAAFEIYSMPMRVNKTMKIDGSADFTFSKDDFHEYSLHNVHEEVISITACVTESLTGLKYNTTTEVTVVRNKFRLTFQEYSSTLKPSLNFSTQLKVCSYDMKPLSPAGQKQSVTLTVTQHKYSPWSWRQDVWDQLQPRGPNSSHVDPTKPARVYPRPLPGGKDGPVVKTLTLPVPASGVVPIHIQLSDDVATLHIEARFQDNTASLALYGSYFSPSKSYIQIRRDHSPTQVGVPLRLTAQSNFPLTEVHYLVMSKGQVVAAGKSSASLTLTPDESWAPQACLVVYTVLTNGEIVNDAMLIPIAQVLRNNVSLSWSQASAKPGEAVTLGVSVTEPESLVGILVVDQATKWLKQENDITLEAVLDELTKYNTDKVSIPERTIMRSDPYSVFKACNLMVLTDALLVEVKDDMQYIPMFREGPSTFQYEEVAGQQPRVRKEFPETWLWLDANISASTTASLPVTVPDSITSWTATAFVMSDNLGLGLVSAPPKLTVFQDFFLSLNVPPYIIRGELLILEVNLFNYLPQELEVMVIVAESESFEFVFLDNDLSMPSTQRVIVRSQDSTTVLFPIKPRILGEMPIYVKAVSSISSDAVIQKVLVKPEGIPRSFSKSLFLELAPTEHRLSKEIVFTFPPNVVHGSKRAEVAVVGDILGPSIAGLESLIQMPYGCGEQNMIHFAPNIYVLQYLTKIRQAAEDIRSKAISFMRQGYQQELSYQRRDGSFSAFGDFDNSGSTWLSAFVLRCFLQARPFISIDPGVLSRTAAWLADQQRPDGAFLEPGSVIHTELQGGLDGPVALTAYVLTALLEEQTFTNQYQDTVSKALAFLEVKLASGISSNYSLCLVAYALSLTNHSSANTALTELINRADIHDNVMSWRSSSSGLSESWQPRSSGIEMAAYVLLTLFKLAMVDQAIPLMKWLIVQRNHLGGYGSTQDTIVALEALSWYAGMSGSAAIDLAVEVVRTPSGTEARFRVDSTNYLLSQNKEIEAEGDIHIQVFAEGRGFALFQLNVFYNLESEWLSRRPREIAGQEAFDLSVDITADAGNMDHFTIVVCTRLLENAGINRTGMVLMDVGLLSGFVLAQEGVKTGDLVKKVETSAGSVLLYLDSMSHSPVCVHIPTMRDFKVAHVQDAVVLVYDYYEPLRKAERTYNSEALRKMAACSFCGADCSQCGGRGAQVSGGPSLTQGAAYVSAALLLLSLVSAF